MVDLLKRLTDDMPGVLLNWEARDEITTLRARLADATEAHDFELAERMKHQAEVARLSAALATARRDALEDIVAIVRRDEQAGDISPGAAQWFADNARALIAQEQDRGAEG